MIIQQARWYKGFYRESIIFFPNIFNYSWYAAFVIAYSFFIPFFAITTVFRVIFSLDDFMFLILYICMATFLMGLRAILRNCKPRFIHSLVHPLFFFLFLLPIKLIGFFGVFFNDVKHKKDRWKILVPTYVWMFAALGIFIGVGIIRNFVVKGEKLNNWMSIGIFVFAVVMTLLFCHWVLWGWGYFIPMNKKKLK